MLVPRLTCTSQCGTPTTQCYITHICVGGFVKQTKTTNVKNLTGGPRYGTIGMYALTFSKP